MIYRQDYNPLHSVVLSTIAAALPVVTLLYFLAMHPTRSSRGSLHKGIAAHKAALIAVATALLIALFIFRMPWRTASMAAAYGALYGLFPIGWIVIAAMFLYTITVISGLFEIVKDSVASLSRDRRLQAILIAFSFGAFVEGAAGFGTPVAISGALMVGLGFRPLQAAILCLIANTAPVAYGALGTPITALAAVTGIEPMLLSKMAARQLPFFSLIVPVWMTAVQVRMDRRPWRDVMAVWPALLVAGGSFAITQFIVGNFVNHLLVDILGGVISMVALALFCRVWHPPRLYDTAGSIAEEAEGPRDADLSLATSVEPAPDDALARETSGAIEPVRPAIVLDYATAHRRHPTSLVIKAWTPWILLTLVVFLWGLPSVKNHLNTLPGTVVVWKVPAIHNVVKRMPPVVSAEASDKGTEYAINWLTAAGTGILIAAILTGFLVPLSPTQWLLAIRITAERLRVPLLTICLILAMGFITKYSGMDAVLGLAFTHTGVLYPFFAAMLGWLGVALTGSDTSSNVMFGSMQKITAEQLKLNPILICTANSTGGVMGKMIDAQSIVVATAACYADREEGKLAAGPIFRGVLVHSILLAILMGMLVMLQAYVFPGMIPTK